MVSLLILSCVPARKLSCRVRHLHRHEDDKQLSIRSSSASGKIRARFSYVRRTLVCRDDRSGPFFFISENLYFVVRPERALLGHPRQTKVRRTTGPCYTLATHDTLLN